MVLAEIISIKIIIAIKIMGIYFLRNNIILFVINIGIDLVLYKLRNRLQKYDII